MPHRPYRARNPRHRRALPALVLPALALSLAACAGGGGGLATTPTAAATASPQATFAPLTLDNCGSSVVVSTPPQRVITIKSSPTETMLALGLGDRIIGTAYRDGPVPAAWAADAAAIPVISEKVPGQEAVLALNPDFVYAGWESNLTADGAGDRAGLAALGIGTYVSPSACKESGYQPDPLTFDDVFGEIDEVGRVFGVKARADELVTGLRSQLSDVKRVSGVSAFWWSSGTDTPYAGGGIGAPQMIMDAAGLTNVLAGVHDTWAPAGWEQVIAADPDVLVLVDASWNSFEKKVAYLESNPALAQLTAVREHRFVSVPFAATEAGVRNVEATATLVDQVRALGLGG